MAFSLMHNKCTCFRIFIVLLLLFVISFNFIVAKNNFRYQIVIIITEFLTISLSIFDQTYTFSAIENAGIHTYSLFIFEWSSVNDSILQLGSLIHELFHPNKHKRTKISLCKWSSRYNFWKNINDSLCAHFRSADMRKNEQKWRKKSYQNTCL